jgi:hypothetical protein
MKNWEGCGTFTEFAARTEGNHRKPQSGPVFGMRFNPVISEIRRMVANNYTMKLHYKLLTAYLLMYVSDLPVKHRL